MKYQFIKHHRNEPDKVLLADLRRAAGKLRKNHITAKEYKLNSRFHLTTICSRFNGWNNALLKAGLKVKFVRRVSDDELLLNMKRVWDTLGRQPKCEDMFKPVSSYSLTAYTGHFGSWQGALLAFVKSVKGGKIKSNKFSLNLTGKKKPVRKKNPSISMRFNVFKRDNFKCRLCGSSPAKNPEVTLHADHIIPASKGGETVLSNLQTLCSACNYGKGIKRI